ncbi:helix-turn-helix domain-containing protein [Ramlibacter sp. WS9]|nr:helix-turn-helix domain-containing protein [Ramlibacter sp. WS9]
MSAQAAMLSLGLVSNNRPRAAAIGIAQAAARETPIDEPSGSMKLQRPFRPLPVRPMNTSPAAWPVFAGIDFERGRLFETRDADEAQFLCGRVFSPHRLRLLAPGGSLHARMDHLAVGSLSLSRLTWQAPVSVDPGALEGYYLLCLPTRGEIEYWHGNQSYRATPGQLALVGGAQRFHFTAGQDYEQIVVRIEKAAVDAAWVALTGVLPRDEICFRSDVPTDSPTWPAIEPALALMAQAARGDLDLAALPHLHARLEEQLLTTLLLRQPHSQLLPRLSGADAASPTLRKAKAYMIERLEEPLTLTALAQGIGVPARTIQSAFNAAEGTGPMQWLRTRRLHAVRQALLSAGGDAPRVADTALRFGFWHLGEFARHYRHAFNETPSATLSRRR